MSVPMSTIYIIDDLAIDSRYEHTLYFEDQQAQLDFFRDHTIKRFSDYTYLRRDWSIKVEANMSDARKWTYLYFFNPQDNKPYFYFINKVEYKNEKTVELFLEMDVIQTYMFDWQLGHCFVERTHTTTDEIGEHTMDEGLETGPLVTTKTVDYPLNDLCILVLATIDENGNSATSKVYDSVFSGLAVWAVDLENYYAFGNWLDSMSTDGKIDGIVSMWVYPKALVKISGAWGDSTLLHTVVGGVKSITVEVGLDPEEMADGISGIIDGYHIWNRKLMTYPYTMLYVTNNAGGSAVYHFERFANGKAGKFELFGALSPDSGVKAVPHDYKGMELNYDEGLTLGAFPTCAWDSDTYKVWLAQNQHTQSLTIDQAKISMAVGATTAGFGALTLNAEAVGNGLNTTYNGYMQIQSVMAQRKDMAIQPPQARGAHSANLNLANDMQGFSFQVKTVTAEYARSIDQYLTRYGYKVNRIMKPNLHARQWFTYIKTIGCVIDGDIGNEDRRKIASIFDNGVTFWTDHHFIGANVINRPISEV